MNKKTIFFIAAVTVQTLILVAVPAKKVSARRTGTLITIKTAPVDPYDFLSGYNVRLSYEISQPKGIYKLREDYGDNFTVYVVLKEGDDGIWNAQSVYKDMPKNIPADCVVIKGRTRGSRVEYGIESYFIPEKHRKEIEQDLRQNLRRAKVQIKVDKHGNAALIRLLIDDRVYEY